MRWFFTNGVWTDGASRPTKVAPIQITPADRSIPLEVAQEAWKEYDAQGHGSQSLDRLCQRGGFSGSELAILLYERIKRMETRAAHETSAAPEPPEKTWDCSVCGRSSYVTETYCRHCDFSRFVTREGRLVPREGKR